MHTFAHRLQLSTHFTSRVFICTSCTSRSQAGEMRGLGGEWRREQEWERGVFYNGGAKGRSQRRSFSFFLTMFKADPLDFLFSILSFSLLPFISVLSSFSLKCPLLEVIMSESAFSQSVSVTLVCVCVWSCLCWAGLRGRSYIGAGIWR